MRELGIHDESLRPVIKRNIKFFDNKERYKKFQSYNINELTEENIEIAILSVLCKLPISDFEQVLKTVLIGGLEINENLFVEDIIKFGDMDSFWKLIDLRYGYDCKEKDLSQLATMLMITSTQYNLNTSIPTSWTKFISTKKADVIVFMDHFMNHAIDSKYFDKISIELEKIVGLDKQLSKWNIEDYILCDTFKLFDDNIMKWLIKCLVEKIGEYEKYRKIINRRRSTHWFNKLSNEYNTI